MPADRLRPEDPALRHSGIDRIGALTGGKKGALIGAAIGGGAASIYEAVKRR